MRKIIFFVFVSFLIFPVAINSSNNTMIQNPGIFIDEISSINISTLDPATNYETQGNGLIQLMYEGFYSYANNSFDAFRPRLATSFSISSDGLTYTFHCRSDVKFANQPNEPSGQPFNAYVMQYSIDRAIIMNDHSGPVWMIDDWIKGAKAISQTNVVNINQAISFLSLESIKATDSNTLVITLSSPDSNLFIQTLMLSVVSAISPKAIIDNRPMTYNTDPNDPVYGQVPLTAFFPNLDNASILKNLGLPSNYNLENSGIVPQSDHTGPSAYIWLKNHYAGTGPYYLGEFVPGSNIILAKNNDWWNYNYFQCNSPDRIKIIQVSDVNTRITDLKNGTTDTISVPNSFLSEFSINVTHTYSPYQSVNAFIYDTLNTAFIGMNEGTFLNSGQVIEDVNSSNYDYGSKNVTKLLKYPWNDTNGNQIIAEPYNPFTSLLFREAFAYAFPTNVFINQALNGFGIRMQGAIPKGVLGYDSKLITQNNIPTFNLSKAKQLFTIVGWKGSIAFSYINGSSEGILAANLLKNYINNLNINITIVDNPLVVNDNFYSSTLKGMAIFYSETSFVPQLQLIYPDPNFFANLFYNSSGIFGSIIHYNNSIVTNLLTFGLNVSSIATQETIYSQIESNATEDYPYIYLFQSQAVILLRDWINGMTEPETNALNAMNNFLPMQFLIKGNYGCITIPGNFFPITTSNSEVTTSIDNTGSMISTLLFTLLVGLGLYSLLRKGLKLFRGDFNEILREQQSTIKTASNQNQKTLNKPLEIICPKCKNEISLEDSFCQFCGHNIIDFVQS